MTRYILFSIFLLIFFFNSIQTIFINDENLFLKRHIGAAREYRYRARHRAANLNQQQWPIYVSPEYIRSRWIELYNEQNKLNET